MRTIAWYINPARIAQFLGTKEALNIAEQIKDVAGIQLAESETNLYRIMLKEKIENYFIKNKIKPLYQLYLNNELKVGQLFSIYQRFYCKGLSRLADPTNIPVKTVGELHEKLSFEDKNDWKIRIIYSPKNLISHSAFSKLLGNGRFAVYGHITEIHDNTIMASPLIIGDPDEQSAGIYIDDALITNYGELHPYNIESFSKVNDFIKSGNELKDISIMRSVPEEKIKKGFSTILGRDIVPIDWGGEKSDLFTSNIKIRKTFVTAAFMFKGPGKFYEMKPKDLGKNGDQIDRLFSEPSQVCVLQHCHKIATSVRSQMKAYANRFYDKRLYSIIDGYQTMNILAAYEQL